jgi:hypothetical protein
MRAGSHINNCIRFAAAIVLALAPLASDAQIFRSDQAPPRPPRPVPSVPAPPTELAPPVTPPPTAPATPSPRAAPVPPPGKAAPNEAVLALAARFGTNLPAITSGLHWRVYAGIVQPNSGFKLVKEDRAANPVFSLAPGPYIINVTFGLASATKPVQLSTDRLSEIFDIAAGGLKIEGRVGSTIIPATQISFDIYQGSQFEPGVKRPIVQAVSTNAVVLIPEGTYHIVSNYGDANAVVRSDVRVEAGKLTDVTVTHRAAVITLKLVVERGGEALANTQWSVLTPGGDVIKESIGAFPRVILAEGEYLAIARNENQTYRQSFKVITGVDGEVEILAR